MGLETRIFGKVTVSFGRTGPTSRGGPPLEVHHFFWEMSTTSETFHQTKVPEIWHNGKQPKISINPKTPFTRAKKIGTARHAKFRQHGAVRHRADDFKARHSQFSMCKRIGPKCNVALVLKILGVPRLPPGGAVRAVLIFLACVNGV